MSMREDCKHYQSRSYAGGETVRKCALDLAPEAPWQCPASCDKYTKRMADVNWRYGSAVTPPTPEAPQSVGADSSVADLLDAAEDIINSAAPAAQAEIDPEGFRTPKEKKKFRWWPFGK